MDNIPVFAPYLGVDTLKHITDALDIGWLGMGSVTKEFETKIEEYLSLEDRYVVATNTGTAALHLGLLAAGVGRGDEVITPSFNYVADHQAVKMAEADIVMCDIRDDNLGIDCAKAETLITDKTKAIIPLHFAGIPCEQDAVYKLADKYKLRVIEDATHAFGTTIDGKKIGSYGDITCFSFDPVKIMTSIDGGCIVVNSHEELELLQKMRILGVDKDTTERYKNKRAWDYDVVSKGYRYHLNNISASIGLSQIKKVEDFITSRQEVCKRYNEAFAQIQNLKTPQSDFKNVAPFIYYLRVLDGSREGLISHLRTHGIDVGIHFIPVHKHSYFNQSICGDMSVTDEVTNQILTIPLHSFMKHQYIDRVIEGVSSYFLS